MPVVGMIARMDDAKDHATVIRALHLLRVRGTEIRVRFFGDGPRRPLHEALAFELGVLDRIEFFRNHPNIPEALGDLDLVIHSSLTEGFGIAVIEAMAAELPVIVSDVPACREIVDSGACGLIVPCSDPEALAGAVEELLRNDSLRRSLVTAATARVLSEYDVSMMVLRYRRVLLGHEDNQKVT